MKIDKVLLIWPAIERKIENDRRKFTTIETLRFPLGIGYLAAYLERDLDIEVTILDMMAEAPEGKISGDRVRWGMSDDGLRAHIKKMAPTMVGVSQMFSYLEPMVKHIFNITKSVDPRIVTVWGGTHPTVAPKECLTCSDADFIVLGEGEKPLKELIERLNGDQSVQGMKSLGYRDGNGEAVINNERSWIEDLDNHVMPARHKVDMSKYKSIYNYFKDNTMANMVSSRGCPFSCTFCTAPTFYQKRYKATSPSIVVDEMECLVKEHGIRSFLLQDENISFDMDRIEGIADEIISRKLDIEWFAEAGTLIARLNSRLIHKLRESGVTELRLPVESGNENILRKMKKPLKLSKVKPVVTAAREAGIQVVSFLLLGIPDETEAEMRDTAQFALETGFDWNHIGLVQPFPGTKIYDDKINQGIDLDYVDIQQYSAPVGGISKVSPDRLLNLREEFNNRLNFKDNYNIVDGKTDTFILRLCSYIERFPHDERLHHYLGLARYKAGDPLRALESFRKAETLMENNAYGSSQWSTALAAHICDSGDAAPYLPTETEHQLGYDYGHDIG